MVAPKTTLDEGDLIAEQYRKGMSIRQLAFAYDYSYTGMRDLLVRHGVEFRPRGGHWSMKPGNAEKKAAANKRAADKAAEKAKAGSRVAI